MAKRKSAASEQAGGTLRGWKAIASYLGVGAGTAQRWSKDGMPVRREGRMTVADAEEVRRWLGKESHMPAPAHVLTPGTDVTAALKESIAAVRRGSLQSSVFRRQQGRKSKRKVPPSLLSR